MGSIVITDLTRFRNAEILCTAGSDMASGACVRPMPYLRAADCERLGILPGAILSGEFAPPTLRVGPHQEDATYSGLRFEAPASSQQFRTALVAGLYDSAEAGFEIELAEGQKHIPVGHPVMRSIITLRIDPGSLEVVEDRYNAGKTKIDFVDGAGHEFRFFSITDLGFHHYAERYRTAQDLDRLNRFIREQPEVHLRLGLSRAWNNGTINGYWMQVNGVYTFPDFFKDIRSYK